MYYIGEFVNITLGDEVLVIRVGMRFDPMLSWEPVPQDWYGLTLGYLRMRMEDMKLPGSLFIRRKG